MKHVVNLNYNQLLQQLSQLREQSPEKVMQEAYQTTTLPPAAEDALQELTAKIATDLQIPHCVARAGLIHIGQQQDIRLSQWLLRLAIRIRLERRGSIV